MFGYLRLPEASLTEADRQSYRAVYCGLCHAMGRELGQWSRLGLSFDLTFACLFFFTFLKEEPAWQKGKPCPVNPLGLGSRQLAMEDHFIYQDLCAAFALMVTSYLEDKRRDGELALLRPFATPLERYFRRKGEGLTEGRAVDQQKANEGLAALQMCLHPLHEEEEKAAGERDPLRMMQANAAYASTLMDLLFQKWEREARWSAFVFRPEDLPLFRSDAQAFFGCLSAWVYLMDAVDDWTKDQKKGKPNPFAFVASAKVAYELARPLLLEQERGLHELALQLPFQRYGALMANVLRVGLPARRLSLEADIRKNHMACKKKHVPPQQESQEEQQG